VNDFIDVKVFRNKSNKQIILTPSKKQLKAKGLCDVLDAKNGSSLRINFVR
jgi:hypothetical protein